MKILLLGKNGQVGWELQRSLAPLGDVVACGRAEVDLGDLAGLSRLVRSVNPAVIVNAAAYTAVDRAETDTEQVTRINAGAVEVLAFEAKRNNGWLVHYSTDYVFDGAKQGFYLETDAPLPINVYGTSKLAGERAIVASGCRHLILRTSWVFAARGANFARTMLRLAAQREEVTVVSDQSGAPTSAVLIADVTALALYRIAGSSGEAAAAGGTNGFGGIYHLAAAGQTTWHGYAQLLVREALRLGAKLKADAARIKPILSSEYPTPAARPHNSRLDTSKLRSAFGIAMPPWEFHVSRMLQETHFGDS